MLISQAYNYLDKQKNKYEKFNIESDDIKFERIHPENASDLNPVTFTIYENKSKLNESNKKILTMSEINSFESSNRAKRPILKGTCSVIGVYNNILSTWQWGWSIPFRLKMENYISRKILNYAFDIDIDVPGRTPEIIQQNMILKTELLNSKIYMQVPSIEIEKYIAIALYLVQGDYYYRELVQNINVKTNKLETIGEIFYILKNVVEG